MDELKNRRLQLDSIDGKISLIFKNPIVLLIGVGLVGFLIRVYYFPWEIPIVLDGLDYFSYAVVTSQEGRLPIGWDLSNNGWPLFLSVFFSISNYNELIEYSNIQRMLTVIISVLTIIPVYFFCLRFVSKYSALIGASIFSLDPKIITNSLLGITETSFVFLGACSLFLFYSKEMRKVYASFGILSLFTLIRYEGIILLIPFIILFVIRFRQQKKFFVKLLTIMLIFILIISPIALLRIQATGYDGITSEITRGGANYLSKHIVQGIPDKDDPIYGIDSDQNRIEKFIVLGFTNLIKYLGWIMIPVLIFFVPIGFFIFLKSHHDKKKSIILCSIFLMIPAFYVYGRGVEETRYLYVLFPIFCVFSSMFIEKLEGKFKSRGILMVFLISVILIGSISYLDYKKIDYNHEQEAFSISKKVVNITSGINHFSPESKYIHVAEVAERWPEIPLPDETGYNQLFEIKKISPENYSSLKEYLQDSKEKGLTHLIADGKQMNADFLNDIFYNEEKYPYLIKEYDSKDDGFNYHVKVFKINYDLFEK